MKRKAWNNEELTIICNVYCEILKIEVAGDKVNKSQYRRDTLPLLDNRTAGSYEMKMCNISAALNDLEMPWILGYKPLAGYQLAVKTMIKDCLK